MKISRFLSALLITASLLGTAQSASAAEEVIKSGFGGTAQPVAVESLSKSVQSQLHGWFYHYNLSPQAGLQTTYNFYKFTVTYGSSYYIDINQTAAGDGSTPNVTYLVFKENGSNNVGWPNLTGNGYLPRQYFYLEPGTYYFGYINNGPGLVNINANVYYN
ncbi:hypothetical protein [Paenibacillus sp. FJAT-26967]|uniref:hypothetical protein n=1 Tax=Paenibacillus sp. FJAT-26967 TaxID=1729690 RepID=UPI000837C6BB|nr:hypothetical protein [Paenibacillus sp. FJAT-26967]